LAVLRWDPIATFTQPRAEGPKLVEADLAASGMDEETDHYYRALVHAIV
jgi:hypothetical protein